jgi:hypothetical protein
MGGVMRNVTNVLTVFILICLVAVEGYGNAGPTGVGSTDPEGYGSRSVLLDPTDGSFEELIVWYGRGMITYPWPSYQYSYANRFDLSDYGLSAPAYLEALELAVCIYSGGTLNDDVDIFVLGDAGGSPDGGDVWLHEVVYDGDWGSIPTWPDWAWVEIDVYPPALLSEDVFYCGVHPYWADATVDFHVPLDDSDNPGDGWIYSGSWDPIAGWGFPGNFGVRATVYTSDEEPPYVTDRYPLDEDYPCGVPPDTLVGCHMCDDESGIDIENCSFSLLDGDGNPVAGTMDVDDTDPCDVIFEFDPDGDLTEGETYTVEILAMDLAGNSTDESWEFTIGYVKIDGTSFGRIKAGFME